MTDSDMHERHVYPDSALLQVLALSDDCGGRRTYIAVVVVHRSLLSTSATTIFSGQPDPSGTASLPVGYIGTTSNHHIAHHLLDNDSDHTYSKMPALVQPHSIMQEPESLWNNSFKSSLGKRQRDGEDDGRLTAGGMFSATNGLEGGYDGGVEGNMMGIAVNPVHQGGTGNGNGSMNRFGMKRLKSTSVSDLDRFLRDDEMSFKWYLSWT